MTQHAADTISAQLVRVCAKWIGYVALISLFLNLLILASPIYMMQIFDRVLTSGNRATLLYLTVILLMAYAVLGALDASRSWLLGRIGRWLGDTLTPMLAIFSIQARPVSKAITSQPLRDARQLQSFMSGQGSTPLLDAPWTPIYLIIIFMLNVWLGAVAVIFALVLAGLGVANDLTTRASQRKASAVQIANARAYESSLRNAEALEAMGMTEPVIARWRAAEREAAVYAGAAGDHSGVISGASKFFRLSAQSLTLGLGALFVLSGDLTPGGMIAASILLGRALAPLEQLISAWRICIATWASFKRIRAILDARPPEPERLALPTPKGKLDVEALSYRTARDQPLILRNISFTLEPGDGLALIGPSGAGKSTLCRLIMGVLTPSAGVVRLDAADIAKYARRDIGPHMGYLPQDIELFPGTVAQNIARMGEPDADLVVRAAIKAGVHDLILRLPEGYDTPVGEDGAGLSVGQRQRIALARAFYGDPKLIVLDEPNSNLDHAGEAALRAALQGATKAGQTFIIVTHRTSIAQLASKALYLDQGQARAFGAFGEVAAKLRGDSDAQARAQSQVVDFGVSIDTGGKGEGREQ